MRQNQTLRRLKVGLPWLALIFLLVALGCILYFHWHEYLSFTTLKQHHEKLHLWANQHYLLTVVSYMLIYIFAIALSVPGATMITLTGGYLFGSIATLYVIISATLGATLLFIIIRATVGIWLKHRTKHWITPIKKGIQENGFYYLLFLRLIPLFPFWVVNIVPALLEVKLKIFMMATILGIIPGSYLYVMLGNSLNTLFKTKQEPNLDIIFSLSIFLPLIGVAILALLPVVYKHWKTKKVKTH